MRIVAPFGFYGAGNIGDEATLNGFAQLLVKSDFPVQVTLGARDPVHTARVEPAFRYFDVMHRDVRRWYALLRANAHAVIGGTPIQDLLGEWPFSELIPLVRAVDFWRVPLAFVGIGVEDLIMEESRRRVTDEIVPRVAGWSVRSDNDRLRLEGLGVDRDRITVAADMAWLIDPVSLEQGRHRLERWDVPLDRPLIGVNLVNENASFDRNPEMVTHVASALDELIQRIDARVVFLSNEIREGDGFDQAAATKVGTRMTRKDRLVIAPADYLAPREMLSIIGCCDLTMSMRYHFCLFSAVQRVPFIAIERSSKVSDLASDLGWQCRLRPPALDPSMIVAYAMRARENPVATRLQLEGAVHKLRQRALLNVRSLALLRRDQITTPNQTPA